MQLMGIIANLRDAKKFPEIEAALMAYLRLHPKDAASWMYEGLALSIELNKGKPADVKTYLGYAATLARRGRDPNQLVNVADLLLTRGYFDQVGPLLDQAADQVPHRGEPLMMSVNLARKTKDDKRMTKSVERLLSLGWMGADTKGRTLDDVIRREARTQVEGRAKELREDDKTAEADALLASMTESEARDLYIRLTWAGDADLDLVVTESLGATARYATPRTVFGGSILKNGEVGDREEIYVCPRGFDGDYTIKVETIFSDPDLPPPTEATLEYITHEGTDKESRHTKTIALKGNSSEAVVVHLEGGRRKEVLPFIAPPMKVKRKGPPSVEAAKAKAKASATPATPAPK
ncbi:hypothetical protein EP7_000643 [Isosphaeraceae bacterium EP7]